MVMGKAPRAQHADLEEITRDVAPEAVLDELEAAKPEAEQPLI